MATRLSLLLSSTLLVGCGSGDGSAPAPSNPDATAATYTYYQDAKPIIDAKCTSSCHYLGGIAPMPLETYEQTVEFGGPMLLNVQDGLMPPWPPDNDCSTYHGDRSLSAAQKEVLLTWFEEGQPEGDQDAEADPIEVQSIELTRIDLDLKMPESYVPVSEPDDYRCFLIPWPEEATTYITGFQATPGNREIVHHIIAYLAKPNEVAEYERLDAAEEGPGFTCFGGPGGSGFGMVGGWAPGGAGADFPAGTGLKIEPGSMIVLQVHYNVLEAGPMADETSIQVRIDSEVEKEAQLMPWLNFQWLSGQSMPIPANDSDVMHSFAADPTSIFTQGRGFTIYSTTLHMHEIGARTSMSIQRNSGDEECLLQIDRWDFSWQDAYAFVEPKEFYPGDKLYIECHWDNSAENQPIYGGQTREPIDMYWGDGTQDEMCVGFLYLTPN